MLVFVLLARQLALREFGLYGTLSAVSNVSIPLGMFGLDLALLKLGSGRAASRGLIRAALIANALVVSLAGALAATALAAIVHEVPPQVFGGYVVCDALLAIVAQHLYRQEVARGRPVAGALFGGVPTAVRLAWAATGVPLAGAELSSALPLYLGMSTAAAVVLSVSLVSKAERLGDPWTLRSMLWNGATFGLANGIRTLANESPRLLLAALIGPSAVALFTAASRVTQFGLLPVQAFLGNRVNRIFDRRASSDTWQQMRRTVSQVALASAALTAIGVALSPLVIGAEYGDAVDVGLILSLAIVPQALTALELDIVTSRGGHGVRLGVVAATLAVNVVAGLSGNALGGMIGVAMAFMISQWMVFVGASRARRAVCR